MTDEFHTYIYTNCRADEGLQQRDGFQFQAVSRNADLAAMAVIQRSLLYEPSPQWMRERRPVSDYPPSLAHVWDGALATAAGVYLGRESGGGREGNQLTHAVVAPQPSAYGLVRPAQLFGAPFWTTVPAPSKQCPALDPGWQPGPFGVPQAQRFVHDQPNGTKLLAALLTELRRPEGHRRRVLFVARRLDLILHWITAATLLIPQRRALEISFKIYTQNPAYAEHRILGVHPDWSSGGASIDNELGYAVFDLERQRWSDITPDEDSRRWVDLFLAEDPYDIMDAVEVAAESGLAGADAMAFSLASVIARPPGPANIRAIVQWLATSAPDLVRRYGAGVVDQLLSSVDRWTTPDLIRLDAAVGRNVPDRAAAVRLALLRAELRDLSSAGRVPSASLPEIRPPAWDDESDRVAVDLFVEQFRPASPEKFEALLRLAYRFSCTPPLGSLEPGLQRFLEHREKHPELPYEPDLWANGEGVDGRLRDLLGRRLADDRRSADDIGDLWWPKLLTDPLVMSTPLDEVVISAAVVAMPDDERLSLIGDSLLLVRETDDPIPAFHRAAAVLWQRSAPTYLEIQRLCSLLPPDIRFTADEFPQLTRSLVTAPSVPTDDEFLAAYALTSRDLWRPSAPVEKILRDEQNIRSIQLALREDSVDPRRLGWMLSQVPPRTLTGHGKRLLDAMIEAKLAVAVLTVLEAEPQLGGAFAERLARRVTLKDWQPAHMAMAFVLSRNLLPKVAVVMRSHFTESLAESVDKFLTRGSDFKVEKIDQQIAMLGPPWPAAWAKTKRSGRPRNMIRRIVGRKG